MVMDVTLKGAVAFGNEKILIYAPTGSDGPLSAAFLKQSDKAVTICDDMADVCRLARDGCEMILLAEETLNPISVGLLQETLEHQPPWSDIPVAIITSGGGASPERLRILASLGDAANVGLLERPFRRGTLLSTVEVAQRARRRQHQVRQLLDEGASAEKKLKSALEEKGISEQRYRFLADSVPQIVWTARPDGILDYYNQRWFDYAATHFEQMEKIGWTYYVHPDDLPNAGRVWQKSIETGGDYEVEFRLFRASDQTYRWHLVRAFPMRNDQGGILQWVGSCTDIHDQRQLSESLSRIAAVVESSDDAILSETLDGIIMTWNAGAQRIFGYTAGEMIGRPTLTLIPAQLRPAESRIIEQVKKGLPIQHHETVWLTKEERRIDVSLSISLIKERSGTFIGVSTIARDITESVLAKRALANSRQELERLVSERTASLQEAVNQMEEFSYCVSHDLRAPLRAMQGYATALLEDYGNAIDSEGQEYLLHIVRAGHRMDRLTRDVLVYSRIPRTAFEMQPVDLDKLVSDIVQHNLPTQSKDSSITIRTPLLAVLGNETFLGQTVSNLLDNAVKFAAKERPLQVRIWTERYQEQVRLWVEDNGIGILPEHQSRVWGMFERIHPQHVYEGTGIGLAIVRKTIERMNGTMGLLSDGATGSKFWIQLPGA